MGSTFTDFLDRFAVVGDHAVVDEIEGREVLLDGRPAQGVVVP
ncbi:MAG: hypothetical protein WKF82_10225 [Nocardioidaceae bacterium]